MVWVRLEDNFPRDAKVLGLTMPAFRLHVTALCHCGEQLTDGVIDYNALTVIGVTAKLPRPQKQLVELERSGLWLRHARGWEIHKFTEYNPTRKDVLARREKAKERQRRWREKGESQSRRLKSVTP